MKLRDRVKSGDGRMWSVARCLFRFARSSHLPVPPVIQALFILLYRIHVFFRESIIGILRFFYNEPLFRSQCASIGRGFRMEQLPYIQGRGKIVIGNDVRFSGKPSITFGHSFDGQAPVFLIGDHTFIGHACGFNIGREIRIGRHCLFSTGVHCYDLDGHPVDAALRRAGKPTPAESVRPVVIGDDVWVGNGALILKGVSIGDRAIIGARCVVTKDVPADVVVAGNPAQIVARLSAVPNE